MTHRPETHASARTHVQALLDRHFSTNLPRFERLWNYYRNPLRAVGTGAAAAQGRWYQLAQEDSLPARLTGRIVPGSPITDDRNPARREVVIENDIAWRIHTLVDFMFGKPIRIHSTSADPALRMIIERTLDTVLEASGGIGLLQDAALLGHVFGHVDLIVRIDESREGAGAVRIEPIDPRRGVAVLNPTDYRIIESYIVATPVSSASQPTQRRTTPGAPRDLRLQVVTRSGWTLEENGRELSHGLHAWTSGQVPIVHIQNASQPFHFEGLSEVEPLIPLQDELNTRLSDRANRITLQSFRMYLAKGIDGFANQPVAPGQLWVTDNKDASIEAFGGDLPTPGEDRHIDELRDALDKASGVPPLASGVVQAKIGNLSSANALRITLMGALSKTARKRVTYGRGLAEVCRLVLQALDHLGVLHTTPADRGVQLTWPDPLPEDLRELLAAA
ncbi:MAG: phage portal protein, partial [bacterium]|nr:phage portal protein [bacterium]